MTELAGPVERVHPVVDFADRLGARLDALVDTPVWSLTPGQQREVLARLAQDQAKLDALRLRVLAEADRSDSDGTDGTVAEGVSARTRLSRREVRADLRLAKKLETYTRLSAALDVGALNCAQARVIVTSLDRLPKTGEYAVSAVQLAQAEEHLVDQAARFDAEQLKVLGWRVYEVIAPEVAEAWEGRQLEAEPVKISV